MYKQMTRRDKTKYQVRSIVVVRGVRDMYKPIPVGPEKTSVGSLIYTVGAIGV